MCVKLNITQFTVLFIGLLFGCLTFIGKVFRNNSGSGYVSVHLVYIDPSTHTPILNVIIISASNWRREMVFFFVRTFSVVFLVVSPKRLPLCTVAGAVMLILWSVV